MEPPLEIKRKKRGGGSTKVWIVSEVRVKTREGNTGYCNEEPISETPYDAKVVKKVHAQKFRK
jgi:hypothetical protein